MHQLLKFVIRVAAIVRNTTHAKLIWIKPFAFGTISLTICFY